MLRPNSPNHHKMISYPQSSQAQKDIEMPNLKEQGLRAMMREMRKVLVAFSGGVDSSYLAVIATRELGSGAVCAFGISPSVSEFQRDEARRIAADHGLNLIEVATDELEDPNYAANPSNRCYFCKSELYSRLKTLAAEMDISYVLDGTNADDLSDHRPGRVAAGEYDVVSPLADIGMSKDEIRDLSRSIGIEDWDKPASPCLSSRIAHGVPVTIERLSKVERGEAFLRQLGFREFRVRVHDGLARIEIAPAEMEAALTLVNVERVRVEFKKFGFRYVTLDLDGFRSGSMNEAIN